MRHLRWDGARGVQGVAGLEDALSAPASSGQGVAGCEMMMSRLLVIIVVVVTALLVLTVVGAIGLQGGDPQPGSGSERATPETQTP